MAVQLVRDAIKPFIHKATDAHAGLLIQRGLQVWQEGAKDDKHDLIDLITHIQPSELYLLAFNRWLLMTYSGDASENTNLNFASVNAKIDGRLFTGLSTGGTLETGAITHHSYGMPMLAGSAVKGAVRDYAEKQFLQRDEHGIVVKNKKGQTQIDPSMQNILNILFGTDEGDDNPNAGYLIWHDAWWIPPTTKQGERSTAEGSKPLVGEVITVHNQKYYSGDDLSQLDLESPIPNQQLAIQGNFYFVIEGDEKWVKFAQQLLQNMLQELGMGAKGASGYGYFLLDDKLNQDIKQQYTCLLNQSPIRDDDSDPLVFVRRTIRGLTQNELVENLSKNVNSFFTKNLQLSKDDEQHCKDVATIIWENHQEIVENWANMKGQKNTQKAYKFVMTHK